MEREDDERFQPSSFGDEIGHNLDEAEMSLSSGLLLGHKTRVVWVSGNAV